jgi:hypothetical protein
MGRRYSQIMVKHGLLILCADIEPTLLKSGRDPAVREGVRITGKEFGFCAWRTTRSNESSPVPYREYER